MNLHSIKEKVESFYTKTIPFLSRRMYSDADIKSNPYRTKPLTKEQKDGIIHFWGPYVKITKSSWKWFEFYNYLNDGKADLSHYIPESLYYPYVDMFFSSPNLCSAMDDKNLYDMYFKDVVCMPRTFVHKINKAYLDADYRQITKQQALELIEREEIVICKVSKDSMSGFGIYFWESKKNDLSALSQFLEEHDNVIIQEVIKQHPILASINESSVNTLRIMTLFFEGEVHVVSSVLRMGTGTARVDNAHSGGITAGVLPSGQLKNEARDLYGKHYERHPNGAILGDIFVPAYEQCCEKAIQLAPRLSSVTRLISWDFSVNEYGEPILIEVNLTYGGVDVHQLCNGPVFGDMTKKVLDEVFAM